MNLSAILPPRIRSTQLLSSSLRSFKRMVWLCPKTTRLPTCSTATLTHCMHMHSAPPCDPQVQCISHPLRATALFFCSISSFPLLPHPTCCTRWGFSIPQWWRSTSARRQLLRRPCINSLVPIYWTYRSACSTRLPPTWPSSSLTPLRTEHQATSWPSSTCPLRLPASRICTRGRATRRRSLPWRLPHRQARAPIHCISPFPRSAPPTLACTRWLQLAVLWRYPPQARPLYCTAIPASTTLSRSC